MNEPIITSLADTDLYKITMQQAALHHYPSLQTTWLYHCRNAGVDLRPILPEIREQIAHVGTLHYTEEELRFLSALSYIKPDFIDFLRIFRMNADAVEIRETGGKLDIRVHGTWCHRGKWEIYILSIISEIYNRRNYPDPGREEGRRRLREKVAMVKEFLRRNPGLVFRLIEFGTRRRFSRAWQEEVLKFLMENLPECLVGTSNVDMARRFGLRPFGTFAHEWLQAHQATGVRLVESQKLALDTWAREFRGELGIALTDVINMDAFLRDFDRYFAKLFDGARHDSGDPYEWTEKLLAHYRKLHIDRRTKFAVYSDSLDFPKALDLCARFEPQIMTSFGIGTNLTNDLGHPALNHVLKMIEAGGQPVAKIYYTLQDGTYSILIDEVDKNAERREAVLDLINFSSSRQTAWVSRVDLEKGIRKKYCTFCPKILAGNGSIRDTASSRCIKIQMIRKGPSGPRVMIKKADRARFEILRSKLMRVASEIGPKNPGLRHRQVEASWRDL